MRQNGREKCGRVAVGLGPKTMNYRESRMVNFPADASGRAGSMQLIARQENVQYSGEFANDSRLKTRFYESAGILVARNDRMLAYGIKVRVGVRGILC